MGEVIGTAERNVAQTMVAAIPGRHRITEGGDKGFDTIGFVAALQELNATPHDHPTLERSTPAPEKQQAGSLLRRSVDTYRCAPHYPGPAN